MPVGRASPKYRLPAPAPPPPIELVILTQADPIAPYSYVNFQTNGAQGGLIDPFGFGIEGDFDFTDGTTMKSGTQIDYLAPTVFRVRFDPYPFNPPTQVLYTQEINPWLTIDGPPLQNFFRPIPYP